VADTLQRYNIATEKEISDKDAYYESFLLGNKWIERNAPYFDGFTIPYEMLRWDDLINAPGFIEKEKRFED
jgi:hypothetical protein